MCTIAAGICLTSYSCKEEQQSVNIKQTKLSFEKEGELKLKKAINDSILAELSIEIADDEYQTQTGLMYRDSMLDSQGMLFIFPDEAYRSFYMKNTQFSLDIIYISAEKKIVSIQKNASPMNETSLPSAAPAKYVLEVNAGLSEKWGLDVGNIITFSQTN